MTIKARVAALEAKHAKVDMGALLERFHATGAPATCTPAERAVVDSWRRGAAKLFGDTGELASSLRQLERAGYVLDDPMREAVASAIAAEAAAQ